jgi:hypothetical protein
MLEGVAVAGLPAALAFGRFGRGREMGKRGRGLLLVRVEFGVRKRSVQWRLVTPFRNNVLHINYNNGNGRIQAVKT